MKKAILLSAMMFSIIMFAQNNSIQMDGVDDHISLGDNYGFNLNTPFTAEAWIKTSNVGLAQIVSKLGTSSGDFRGWGLQVSSTGQLEAYVSSAFFTNKRYFRGTLFIADDVWHHVAMVYDGGEDIILYADGAVDPISGTGHDGATLGEFDTIAPTHIGNYDGEGSPDEYFLGFIDDVRIWDIARTSSAILASWNTELSGNETGLIGYYKMDTVNSSCDIEDCNDSETHGTREGPGGTNGLPQFSSETSALVDVACGASINCTLGIETSSLDQDVTMYPNPTRNSVFINGFDMEGPTYIIFSIKGERMHEGRIINSSIDLSSIPSGIYFVSIQSASKKITKKVVKL